MFSKNSRAIYKNLNKKANPTIPCKIRPAKIVCFHANTNNFAIIVFFCGCLMMIKTLFQTSKSAENYLKNNPKPNSHQVAWIHHYQ